MARTKSGLINSLAKLPQLLQATSALEARVAKLEKLLLGAVPGKRGRKPRRKLGRPRKAGRPKKQGRKRGRKPTAKKVCTLPGCVRKHYAKGLCASHYQTALRKKKEARAKG